MHVHMHVHVHVHVLVACLPACPACPHGSQHLPSLPFCSLAGQDIQPKRDISRFVKWPKYVRLQRQERVLVKRLKVPPSLNQFTQALDKATATQLFKLLAKYKPEDKAQKKQRLRKLAEEKATKDTTTVGDKPMVLKYGLNHVTALIEQRKARLVVIAHDVDPIEVCMPTRRNKEKHNNHTSTNGFPALCGPFAFSLLFPCCTSRTSVLS